MSPTNDNDDLGNLIGRELHSRVDDLHEAPLTFRDVQGRATRIRRGRRIAAGVGLAAAAAILVPTALIAGSGLDRSQEPDPAPRPSSPTATEGSPGAKPTVPLDVSGLETGEPPAVTWLEGTTAHLASGETLELSAAYQSITEVGDRLVVTGNDDAGNLAAVVLSEAGEPEGSFPLTNESGIVSNGKGSAAAWIGPDGVPMVLQDGRDEPVAMAAVEGSGFGIGGLVGDDCTADCEVYVNAGSDTGQRRSWVVSADGSVTPTRDSLLAVSAADPDGSRLMALTKVTDSEVCYATIDASYETEWDTCRDKPEVFSADGQYLATVPANGDGYGPVEVSVLDASSGEPVVRFEQNLTAQATPFDVVWEDSEHLLAAVFQNSQWSIVRFRLDGTMENAVAPRAGEDLERPFFVAH
jgi:hypothetical protein